MLFQRMWCQGRIFVLFCMFLNFIWVFLPGEESISLRTVIFLLYKKTDRKNEKGLGSHLVMGNRPFLPSDFYLFPLVWSRAWRTEQKKYERVTTEQDEQPTQRNVRRHTVLSIPLMSTIMNLQWCQHARLCASFSNSQA